MTGADVRAAWKTVRLSMTQLARRAGVPAPMLGSYERIGYLPEPVSGRQDRLRAIVDALKAAGARMREHHE